MWLFTAFGFFSVVAHRDKPDDLLVRSRARTDLETLLSRSGLPSLYVEHTPDADYPYRVTLPRKHLALVVAATLTDIDYTNFKSAVGERQGMARELAYHDVWAAVRQTEDEGARSEPRARQQG